MYEGILIIVCVSQMLGFLLNITNYCQLQAQQKTGFSISTTFVCGGHVFLKTALGLLLFFNLYHKD